MSALLPMAVYGLEVPPGDLLVPAHANIPAMLRITMAAIDPTADPEGDLSPPRATLKLIRRPLKEEDDDSDDDDLDDAQMRVLLNGDADGLDTESSEEDSDDEEVNGGPSDPSKSKKAKKEAAAKAIIEALQNGDGDDMEVDGQSKKDVKGKGKMVNGPVSDDDSSETSSVEADAFVICTLDPAQHYQQPLDITVGENERVLFQVSGTHTIYLTGNYVVGPDDSDDDDYNEMGGEYDLEPDDDEIDYEGDSDELDDVEDPRITELGSDEEEEAPKLTQGKKRAAPDSEDEPSTLDELMKKSEDLVKAEPATNGEAKLSKKQRKKLKNQAGQSALAPSTVTPAPGKNGSEESGSSSGKKVQFAEKLEQGPTPPKGDVKTKKEPDAKPQDKSGPNVKTVNGVIIDDRKAGDGKKATKGSKLEIRYIGKLKDGKVFDANKKGKPFSVKLGAGEVIKGFDIGLEGIAAGGERKLTIPANLAYGNKAKPGIPANSQLVFDIKCLNVH